MCVRLYRMLIWYKVIWRERLRDEKQGYWNNCISIKIKREIFVGLIQNIFEKVTIFCSMFESFRRFDRRRMTMIAF